MPEAVVCARDVSASTNITRDPANPSQADIPLGEQPLTLSLLLSPIAVLVIATPGAKTSTTSPKFEKLLGTSSAGGAGRKLKFFGSGGTGGGGMSMLLLLPSLLLSAEEAKSNPSSIRAGVLKAGLFAGVFGARPLTLWFSGFAAATCCRALMAFSS